MADHGAGSKGAGGLQREERRQGSDDRGAGRAGDAMSDKTTLFDILDQIGGGALTALVGATIGRLMWHSSEVRKRRRRFWSRELLLEAPIVIGMALMSEGVTAYFSIDGPTKALVIGGLSGSGHGAWKRFSCAGSAQSSTTDHSSKRKLSWRKPRLWQLEIQMRIRATLLYRPAHP